MSDYRRGKKPKKPLGDDDVAFIMPNSTGFKIHRNDSEVFTDSALNHWLKTLLAKVKQPKLKIRLQGAFHELTELASDAGAAAVAYIASKLQGSGKPKPPALPPRRPSGRVAPRRGSNVITPRGSNARTPSGSDVITPRGSNVSAPRKSDMAPPPTAPKPTPAARTTVTPPPAPSRPAAAPPAKKPRPAPSARPPTAPEPEPLELIDPMAGARDESVTPSGFQSGAPIPDILDAAFVEPPKTEAPPSARPEPELLDLSTPPAVAPTPPKRAPTPTPPPRRPVATPSAPRSRPKPRPRSEQPIAPAGPMDLLIQPSKPVIRDAPDEAPPRGSERPIHISPVGASPVSEREREEEERAAEARAARAAQRQAKPSVKKRRRAFSVRNFAGPHFRRYRLAALVAALIVVIAVVPGIAGMTVAGMLDEVSSLMTAIPRPVLTLSSEGEGVEPEEIAQPAVTEDADPGVVGGFAAFVGSHFRSIKLMFAGPLVDQGATLAVADFEATGIVDASLAQALALALEEELSQSTRFSVVRRERVRIALLGESARGIELSGAQATTAAASREWQAIVTGRIEPQSNGTYRVQVVVLDTNDDELYSTAWSEAIASPIVALSAQMRDLRMRLGESEEEIEGTLSASAIFGGSTDAIVAYALARGALFEGDYSRALAAADRALEADEGFALAYRTRAEALALTRKRRGAKAALDAGWKFRSRLTERERLRMAADRAIFEGEYRDAVLGYERLFTTYRDDVTALKSQAIAQSIIGTRGGGLGNLELARSLDPTDWPPLSQVARYLGYRGDLPEKP